MQIEPRATSWHSGWNQHLGLVSIPRAKKELNICRLQDATFFETAMHSVHQDEEMTAGL